MISTGLPINRSLFETEAVALARLKESEIEILIDKSRLVIQRFSEYFDNDQDFKNSLLYATGKRICFK